MLYQQYGRPQTLLVCYAVTHTLSYLTQDMRYLMNRKASAPIGWVTGGLSTTTLIILTGSPKVTVGASDCA